ncbi:MAG: hypothetical protein M1131_00905 [Actinobacteria bacterium]|nr:hypothetical protein [Actinomycetota bacterium]MCL6094783.1 hypothetical protein [Actinomycetota bacterium]
MNSFSQRPWPRFAAMIVPVILVILLGIGLGERSIPAPVVHLRIPSTIARAVPSPAPDTWPWPVSGQAAVGVEDIDDLVALHGTQTPVPIASLAKLMTAYIVLVHHPLLSGQPGPEIKVTSADQGDWAEDLATDQSSIPLQRGEELTERQLLDALLVRSANDVAKMLARWTAGSVAAFVHEMNTTAEHLGLHHTHYTSPSGYNPTTVSTASDVLRLVELDMANPTFAAIVDQPEVVLPLIPYPVRNYVKGIGRGGVVGVKSGFTNQAGGCIALALRRPGPLGPVTSLAVVLGQQGYRSLDVAQNIAKTLDAISSSALEKVIVLDKGEVVGYVKVPWRHRTTPVITGSGLTIMRWPTQSIKFEARLQPLSSNQLGLDQVVGDLVVKVDPHRQWVVPLVAAEKISPPSFWWRVWR